MLKSLPAADVFEIFSITERENSYTSLLAYLLAASERLREQLIRRAFDGPTPLAGSFTVERQAALDPRSIADVLLQATDASGARWELFIEAKVHASEQGDQTPRYYKACVKRTGSPARVGGLFLTLSGTPPLQYPQVRPLIHRELADWINDVTADFCTNIVLQNAATAYVARAHVPVPKAEDSTPIQTLLSRQEGLVPRLAGADVLATACTAGLPDAWEAWSVLIQGRGHASPGLVFRLPDWLGPAELGLLWTSDNYNLHLEVELNDTAVRRLKLHFETNPYLPQRKLNAIAGSQEFAAMRERFRKLLSNKLADAPGWKMKGKKLQVAVYTLPLGASPTVGQFRDVVTPALRSIAPLVSKALSKARKS